MHVGSIIATVAFAASLGAGVACAVTRRVSVARFARIAGFVALAVGTFTIIESWVEGQRASFAATTQVDRRRVTANVIAETAYGFLITAAAVTPALLASWWVLRKRSSAGHS